MSVDGPARGWRGLAYWIIGTAMAWAAGFVATVDFTKAADLKWAAVLKASAAATVLLLSSLLLLRATGRAVSSLSRAGRIVGSFVGVSAILPALLVIAYGPMAIIARLDHNPHGPLGDSGLTGSFWPVLASLAIGNGAVAASAGWLLWRLRAAIDPTGHSVRPR